MKIKRKVEMNLPQLIEWAMDNDIKHRVFKSNPNFDGVTYKLGFDIGGDLYFEESLTPTLLFTVEVEEEITEDTVHTMLIATCKRPTLRKIFSHRDNISIRQYKELEDDDVDSFYMLNDDSTMTLIWRDGRLIE